MHMRLPSLRVNRNGSSVWLSQNRTPDMPQRQSPVTTNSTVPVW